jgi:hypothetical protein
MRWRGLSRPAGRIRRDPCPAGHAELFFVIQLVDEQRGIGAGRHGHGSATPTLRCPSWGCRPQRPEARDGIGNSAGDTSTRRQATLVAAIARGRRWLDEIVAGTVTSVEQIAARDKCSIRQFPV